MPVKFPYPPTNLEWLWSRTIFLTRHGSHAYGTNTPTSDEDWKGLCIPPAEYYYGFVNRFEQAEFRQNPDCVVYSIQKFFKLAADCNPSIIEVLFATPENHAICTPAGQQLLDNRDLFISKKAKHTFSGFAVSQLKKLLRTAQKPPERVNPVRAKMIQEFGYDGKDAMHTIRLLRMGIEILKGEGVNVFRQDAAELLEIRNGKMSLGEVVSYATGLDAELERLYNECNAIPHEPDRNKLDALCCRLTESALK